MPPARTLWQRAKRPSECALSMAAISRTFVAGTWLKMFRYQCTMHRCQVASGKKSAALSQSPRQASEMINLTRQDPAS